MFIYIDKANSFENIRIAEKIIWGYIIPQKNYDVKYLLFQTTKKEYKKTKNVFIIKHSSLIIINYLKFIIKLILLIRKINPKYIVVRNVVDLGIISIIISNLTSVKFIYVKAFPSIEFKIKNNKNKIYKSILLYLLKVENYIIKNSDYLIIRTNRYRKFLIDNYAIDRESIIVPMGFYEKMRPSNIYDKDDLRKKYINGKKFLGIYFGSLHRSRKITFILDAIKETESNNIQFLFIGGTPEEVQYLNSYSQKHNILNVIIQTAVPRNILFNIIEISDFSLSIIPPLDEYILSSPTKVIESLALGCPVIVNKEILDQYEVISESNGGIIIDYDKYQLNESIKNINNSNYNLNKMGFNGKLFIDKHRNYRTLGEDILSSLFK